jgi:phosphopantothenoylcysteine decarboxylase/phosphopantothenate--cysteine ligase
MADADPRAFPLRGRRILLGVSGGIAAYKAAELVRGIVKAGGQVRCVMTRAAEEFVTARTLAALSGHRVLTSVFDDAPGEGIDHIRLADECDLLIVAPCTAHVLARLAHGLADDLLSTVALATRAPVLLAPALNVNMWQHAATRENLGRVLSRGAHTVGPEEGELACGWIGAGRMAEPVEIVAAAARVLGPGPLAGRRVLVSAGPTFEPIDPVRYLGNRSSGKMGYALAAVARARGARVDLVSGPVALPDPPGVTVTRVETTAELGAALESRWRQADIVVMSAAVADFRPAQAAAQKLDRRAGAAQLALLANPDLLAGIGEKRRAEGLSRPLLVGFAAETASGAALVERARAKLGAKGCDVVIANDVSGGQVFGQDQSSLVIVDAAGETPAGPAAKVVLAAFIWDRLASLL